MKNKRLFGIEFSDLTQEQVVRVVLEEKPLQARTIVTPNVDFVVRYSKSRDFRDAVDSAHLRVADGTPIVWFDKFFKRVGIPERVTGADLLPAICFANSKYQKRIVFVGGKSGVAEIARQKLLEICPDVNVVSTYSPKFGFENDKLEMSKLFDFLNSIKPDIVFFGVGSPKQELFLRAHENKLPPAFYLCTGAAVDFVAGIVKRAPVTVQKLGFEWLWRFFQEPKRLFHRYFVVDSYFIVLVFKEIFRR